MMGDGVVRRAITLRKMGDFCWTKKGGTLKGLTTPSLLLSESKAQQVTVLGTPNIYVSGHQVLTASSDVFQKKASNVSQISQSIVLFPLFFFRSAQVQAEEADGSAPQKQSLDQSGAVWIGKNMKPSILRVASSDYL